ncbi:hypothetical protein KAT08_02445 [Candidatus Babeliales bacterium]|nr:hypothetical protein [Candidatus Babeliales bacterium]
MVKVRFLWSFVLLSFFINMGVKSDYGETIKDKAPNKKSVFEGLIRKKLTDIQTSFYEQLNKDGSEEQGNYVVLEDLLKTIAEIEGKLPKKGVLDKAGKKIKSIFTQSEQSVDEKISNTFEKFVADFLSGMERQGEKVPNIMIKKEDLDALSFYLMEYFKIVAENSWQNYIYSGMNGLSSSAYYSFNILRYFFHPFYYAMYPAFKVLDFVIGIELIKKIIRTVAAILILKVAYTKVPLARWAMDEMMFIAKGLMRYGLEFAISIIKEALIDTNGTSEDSIIQMLRKIVWPFRKTVEASVT